MGGMIRAEFRKIFSTRMWWGLLIPAVVVALLANWAGSALASIPALQQDQYNPPYALFSLGLSMQFTTLFAGLFGALAIAGEFRHRTITTTYLTGYSRGGVLTAKLGAYLVVGVVYGVLGIVASSLGALFGDGSAGFPSGTSWLLVSLSGVLVITLWTLLGVGLGALVSNQVAVVVLLLCYRLIGETVLGAIFSYAKVPQVTPYLPGNAGSGAVNVLAFDRFVHDFPPAQGHVTAIRDLFSLDAYPAWWASALVFAGYAAVLVAAGWLVSRHRDIT